MPLSLRLSSTATASNKNESSCQEEMKMMKEYEGASDAAALKMVCERNFFQCVGMCKTVISKDFCA